MSVSPGSDAACAVRGSSRAGAVRLHTRNHTLSAEGQLSYAPRSEHPSALDYLVSALAADLIAGLIDAARRAGVILDDVELNLTARLDNPLVAIGVVGESGSARLSEVRGSLYVGTDAPPERVAQLWAGALERAPVYATLVRSTTIDIAVKPIP